MSGRYLNARLIILLIPVSFAVFAVFSLWQVVLPAQAARIPVKPDSHPAANQVASPVMLSPTLTIIVDDFLPQPEQGNIAYYYNRLGGDRGALNMSQLSFGLGAVTATIAPGQNWGGMWNSLNHIYIENQPIDFSSLLPASILPEYQSKITGVSVHIRDGTPNQPFRLELKDPTGSPVYIEETIITGGPQSIKSTIPEFGEIQELVWLLHNGAPGNYAVVDYIALTASTMITDTGTAAFVWSYGMLLNNYNPSTGLVRDKARIPSGDFDAIQATGALAAATAQAYQLGVVNQDDAIQIVTQISDTLLLEVPAFHGLWPHWVEIAPGDTLTIPAGTEWSSVDTAIATLALLTAQQALGQDAGGTEQFIQSIDWEDLLRPGIGLGHGYNDEGNLLSSSWDTFGGESWLIDLLYSAAISNPDLGLAFPSPPTANGSGFIDEMVWLFVPPPTAPDIWENDWDAYRDQAILTQTTYNDNNFAGDCLEQLGLFGLSAAEVPLPSAVATENIYQPFGVGGQFAAANDGSVLLGAPVAVPHYAGMIARRSSAASLQMWAWLMHEGLISPLTNVESLLFPSGASCDLDGIRWNGLKGSWNLALQTLGWGNYLLAQRGHIPLLWQAAMASQFLHDGYDVLVPDCIMPTLPNLVSTITGGIVNLN